MLTFAFKGCVVAVFWVDVGVQRVCNYHFNSITGFREKPRAHTYTLFVVNYHYISGHVTTTIYMALIHRDYSAYKRY